MKSNHNTRCALTRTFAGGVLWAAAGSLPAHASNADITRAEPAPSRAASITDLSDYGLAPSSPTTVAPSTSEAAEPSSGSPVPYLLAQTCFVRFSMVCS